MSTQAISALRSSLGTCAAILIFSTPLAQAAIDLKQAFSEASTRSEKLPIQQTVVDQAAETYSQAKGSILPSVNLAGTYTQQDKDPTSVSARRSNQTNVRVTGTQPIFRGFREYAGLRLTHAELLAEQLNAADTRLSLFESVALSYYDVLAADRDLADLRSQLALTEQRVSDLSGRSRIGRTRKGEVLAAQSQLAKLKSEIEAASQLLQSARQRFGLETGLPMDTELKDDADEPSVTPDALDRYLSQIENRPDIEALRKRVEASDEGVSVARGAHLPSIDVAGNYYLKRQSAPENSKWDFNVTATLPVFQGGVTQSLVRQASAQRRQAELELSYARRRAEQEIRDAHQSLVSGLAQLEALRQSADLADKNYQEQTRDYRLGLVTNLDVLQAMDSHLAAKRGLDRTRYKVRLTYWNLQTSVGRLP